jgi:hypothetical protein
MLPDPNVVVDIDDLGFEITCADVELNEENLSCDVVQSTYSSICCAAVSIQRNETLDEDEVATGENKTVREMNETIEEVIDDNSTDVDSSGTVGGNENDTTIDNTENSTGVNANKTMNEPADDASTQNTTMSDTSETTDDTSAEQTTGVDLNDTSGKEDENAAVDDTTVPDSNETTENTSDSEDTGDAAAPSSDLGQPVMAPDDVSSLASSANTGGMYSSLHLAVAIGVIMFVCQQAT